MRALSVGGVQEGGVAAALGVREGDEVVLLNDRTVAALSWGEVTHTLTGTHTHTLTSYSSGKAYHKEHLKYIHQVEGCSSKCVYI